MSGRRRPRQARVKPDKQPARDQSQPVDRLSWTVDEEDAGERLDRFLGARLTWRSRTSIVTLIEQGEVSIGGQQITRKAERLRPGDRVDVAVPPPEEKVRHEEIGLELQAALLFEDEHMLVVSKPPGLVVHPVGRIRANTLIQALHWLYGPGPKANPEVVPRICHRLDRDTSGVIVVAKTLPARSRLQAAFERHEMEKVYEAFVVGRWPDEAGRIDLPIGPDEEAEIELSMTVRPDGAPSATRFRLLRAGGEVSQVEFTLETGRQHQIRVHAQAHGHPVLCDALYGDGRLEWGPGGPGDEVLIRRQALHARRLKLEHPLSREPLEFQAPLPADMEAVRRSLAGEGSQCS